MGRRCDGYIELVADRCSEHREQQARLCTACRQFCGISAPLRHTANAAVLEFSVLGNFMPLSKRLFIRNTLCEVRVYRVKFHRKVCKSEHASALPRSRKYTECRQKIESRIQYWTDVQYEDVIFLGWTIACFTLSRDVKRINWCWCYRDISVRGQNCGWVRTKS